jgi:hypothetical protein
MKRVPEPWHLLLVGLSAALEWLLLYRRKTRIVKAHLHFGRPRNVAD